MPFASQFFCDVKNAKLKGADIDSTCYQYCVWQWEYVKDNEGYSNSSSWLM